MGRMCCTVLYQGLVGFVGDGCDTLAIVIIAVEIAGV